MTEFQLHVNSMIGRRETVTISENDTLTAVVQKVSQAYGDINTIDAVRVSLCPQAAHETGRSTAQVKFNVPGHEHVDNAAPSTDSATVAQCGLTAAHADITHAFISGTLRSGTPLLIVQVPGHRVTSPQ